MSIILAVIIEAITIVIAGAILFAGAMRTTGGTRDDNWNAAAAFVFGTSIAALFVASHRIGW